MKNKSISLIMALLMIEVSVIIPTWNRKPRLRRALETVLAQESVAFELIVVDDGSTDGTETMIAAEFPSVTYVRQKNQGPAAARNTGIRQASGAWIAFLDSDDEWMPRKLRTQLSFFEGRPDYRICQSEEIWIRNGRRVNPMDKHRKYGGQIFERCLPLCIISPSAVMMARDLFDEVGLFDETFPACEDYDLWLRIASRFPVGLIESPHVIRYGGHSDQQSQAYQAMDQFRIRALVNILNSNVLTPEQRRAAAETLEDKAAIYIRGATKRGKNDEAARVQAMLSRLETSLPA
ncbi:MAG: glycosyltransferase family 2 protein [Candidatus Omnitrophota bacterium]|nr:glycosyltransferase family 2 protein [Candidatus Omnitrophota bacterium]